MVKRHKKHHKLTGAKRLASDSILLFEARSDLFPARAITRFAFPEIDVKQLN